MRENGRVVAIENDCLWVETIRQSTCNTCSAQKGCGHGMMNKIGNGRRHHIRVLLGERVATDFAIDDQVEISVPEQVLVSGALLVYLLPLVTLLAGASVIGQWWPGDFMAFIGALCGFAMGVGMVRIHAQFNRNNITMQPVLIGLAPATGYHAHQQLHPS